MLNNRKLLIASSNQGKIREIKEFLAELDFSILGLDDFNLIQEVIEDKKTFKGNALKKARIRAKETNLLTLADDSGLEVDFLNGAPGVFSARFAGLDASDNDNMEKLLTQLAGVPDNQRKACFKCVMVLVDPKTNQEFSVTGVCEGYIAQKKAGENGFGYDPIFYLSAYQKTMAELPLTLKNKISHRAQALKKLKYLLKNHKKYLSKGDNERI